MFGVISGGFWVLLALVLAIRAALLARYKYRWWRLFRLLALLAMIAGLVRGAAASLALGATAAVPRTQPT